MPYKIHVLLEARPSAHNQTRTEDTPRGIHHVTHLTYPAQLLKFWSFSSKAKYARLRTLLRSLLGFRSSSFHRAMCHGQSKVSPFRAGSGFMGIRLYKDQLFQPHQAHLVKTRQIIALTSIKSNRKVEKQGDSAVAGRPPYRLWCAQREGRSLLRPYSDSGYLRSWHGVNINTEHTSGIMQNELSFR